MLIFVIMKAKKSIKLPLTDSEKAQLRKQKIKIANLIDFAVDEIAVLIGAANNRAKEIYALAEFQTVPTIGIKFAQDLVFLGYYSLQELKNKDGAQLTDEYEKKLAFRVDPCVEDQFRLVVNYAKTQDNSKTWWDFTEERKNFRAANGYPESRPEKPWYQV